MEAECAQNTNTSRGNLETTKRVTSGPKGRDHLLKFTLWRMSLSFPLTHCFKVKGTKLSSSNSRRSNLAIKFLFFLVNEPSRGPFLTHKITLAQEKDRCINFCYCEIYVGLRIIL